LDRPITRAEAFALATSPGAVATHRWLPLVGYTKRERRRKKWKKRPIAYASHADASIFSYYTFLLTKPYEQALADRHLQDVVLAYRRHPYAADGRTRGKANYHFAAEVFADIAARSRCRVVTLDVRSFFDRVPHRTAKQGWKGLLGGGELPRDHFVVFRAATRFSVVNIDAAMKALGLTASRVRRERRITCSPQELHQKIQGAGLIQVNAAPRGIPQGLPISGLLSNIAMLAFDTRIATAARSTGCTYRRYSDDIVLIGESQAMDALELLVLDGLSRLDLKTNPDKRTDSTIENGRVVAGDKEVQYLGFTFDGARVIVRHSTVARHQRRMAAAVWRAWMRGVRPDAVPVGHCIRIRRRKLYAKFSHLGPDQFLKRCTDPPVPGFRDYVDDADGVLRRGELAGQFVADVKYQMRGLWPFLHKLIKKAESKPKPAPRVSRAQPHP
jgi:hypothetical protein